MHEAAVRQLERSQQRRDLYLKTLDQSYDGSVTLDDVLNQLNWATLSCLELSEALEVQTRGYENGN